MAEYIFKIDGVLVNDDGECCMHPEYVCELVRCKDCKHRYHSAECPCLCDDHFYPWIPDDDWFCKKGERKEE